MVRNSIILPKFPVPNVEHPYGYVYLTTNLINGMLYVGQHKATQFNSRYYGGGSYFCRALSAYGSKNFKCKILDWAESPQELNDKEAFWVDYLATLESSYGYNLVPGGRVVPDVAGEKNPMYGNGWKVSGSRNGMYGRHHTDETKRRLSEQAVLINQGENNPFFGHHHTDETKRKIGLKNSGRHHTEDWKLQASKDRLGKVWVTDCWSEERWIHPEESLAYLGLGWKQRRLTFAERFKFKVISGGIKLEKLLLKVKYHEDKYGKLPRLRRIDKGDWVDLYAAETVELKAGEFKLISLGISTQFPSGYEAHMATRSSTYKNWGILLANSHSIIDESYNGDNDIWWFPALAMRNTIVKKGDRIAQFRLVEKMPEVEIEEVTTLGNPDRGGLGSTGTR